MGDADLFAHGNRTCPTAAARVGVYAGSMNRRDEQSADLFAERRAAAEAYLWRKMDERGMTREGGWKVAEFTRDTRLGTEVVLRPMHLWHDSPYDLECVAWVHPDGGVPDSSCTPQPMRRT